MAEYLKFLKGTLVLATATLNTADIPMPVQRGQGRGMNLAVVIHRIEVEIDHTGITGFAGSDKQACLQFTKSTPAAIGTMATQDLVARFVWRDQFLSDVGNVIFKFPETQIFNPPIMIPNEKLVVAGYEDLGGACTFTYRIGYTIRSVSQDELYAALNNQ